jgi:uncharacterized protein (TIGR02466 family)
MKMSTKKKKINEVIDTSANTVAANTNSKITFYPEPVTNQLFPTPVLFTKLPRKYTNEEVEFIQKCALNVTKNTGNTTSVDRYVFEEPVMADLKSYVQFYLNYYMNEIECSYNSVEAYITQSWLNYTQPGEFHHKHEHPNSYISGVLYINADPEKDKIYFYKNGYKRISLPTERYNQFNSESWWFNVGTCDMVLFPSYLTHMVEQTVSTDTRISIAFNTFLKGYIGAEESLTALHTSDRVDTKQWRKTELDKPKDGRGGSI